MTKWNPFHWLLGLQSAYVGAVCEEPFIFRFCAKNAAIKWNLLRICSCRLSLVCVSVCAADANAECKKDTHGRAGFYLFLAPIYSFLFILSRLRRWRRSKYTRNHFYAPHTRRHPQPFSFFLLRNRCCRCYCVVVLATSNAHTFEIEKCTTATLTATLISFLYIFIIIILCAIRRRSQNIQYFILDASASLCIFPFHFIFCVQCALRIGCVLRVCVCTWVIVCVCVSTNRCLAEVWPPATPRTTLLCVHSTYWKHFHREPIFHSRTLAAESTGTGTDTYIDACVSNTRAESNQRYFIFSPRHCRAQRRHNAIGIYTHSGDGYAGYVCVRSAGSCAVSLCGWWNWPIRCVRAAFLCVIFTANGK